MDLALLQAWWSSLGAQGPHYAWLAAGAIAGLSWAAVAYQVIRRLLGHRKIRGVWLTPQAFEDLLDGLQRREKDGVILQAWEVGLLDVHRSDRRLHLKRLGDAEFVSW